MVAEHIRQLPQFSDMNWNECLSYWALINREKHDSINMLLRLLHAKLPGILLPADARCLLNTPKTKANVVEIPGGYYWHCGLKHCLEKRFQYA